MLEAYSLNVEVDTLTAIPFNNVTLRKGCTAVMSGNSTIELNNCGVYMVACNASTTDPATIQLYKDGVAQPQAQSTGSSPCFITLVQVDRNNCGCACSSPVTLQVINATDAAVLFDDANIIVTKVC